MSIIYSERLIYFFISFTVLFFALYFFDVIQNDFLKGFLTGFLPVGLVAIYISRWKSPQKGKHIISKIEISDSGLQLNTIFKGKTAKIFTPYNEIKSAQLDSTFFNLTLNSDVEYSFFVAYQDYKAKKQLQELVARIN